jgi:hypothetical protein
LAVHNVLHEQYSILSKYFSFAFIMD